MEESLGNFPTMDLELPQQKARWKAATNAAMGGRGRDGEHSEPSELFWHLGVGLVIPKETAAAGSNTQPPTATHHDSPQWR